MKALLFCALVALAPAVLAQPISADELDDLFEVEPRVEVNLRGSLLRLASAAAGEEDPAAAAMLDGLRAVTVRIYPSPPDVRGLAVERFSELGRRLERAGWLTLVRVRSLPDRDDEDGDDDTDGDVWIYVRDDGDVFDGMAVLAVDEQDENAVFVFIDGTIDPTQVAALSRRFANVDVDDDEEIDVDVDVEYDEN